MAVCPRERPACLCGTSNSRSLWMMFLLNTCFTSVQLVAALVANSLSMLGDTGSMFVDSLSYLVNLFAESRKHDQGKQAAKVEAFAALLSVALLVAVTTSVLVDASHRLSSDPDEKEVNGKIMVGFSSANLIVDILMCFSFFMRKSIHDRATTGAATEPSSASALPLSDETGQVDGAVLLRADEDENLTAPVSDTSVFKDLNMNSAFVHIFADTLRSLTSLTSGLLVWVGDFDSVRTDAISSLIVCSTIMLAAGVVALEAFQRLRQIFCTGELSAA